MNRLAQRIVAFGTCLYIAWSVTRLAKMAPLLAFWSLWNFALLIFVSLLAVQVYRDRRWARQTLQVYYGLMLAWTGLWAFVMSSTRPPRDLAAFEVMKRNAKVDALWSVCAIILLAVVSRRQDSKPDKPDMATSP